MSEPQVNPTVGIKDICGILLKVFISIPVMQKKTLSEPQNFSAIVQRGFWWGFEKLRCKLKILAVINPWNAAVGAGKEGKAIKQRSHMKHRQKCEFCEVFTCPGKKILWVYAQLD